MWQRFIKLLGQVGQSLGVSAIFSPVIQQSSDGEESCFGLVHLREDEGEGVDTHNNDGAAEIAATINCNQVIPLAESLYGRNMVPTHLFCLHGHHWHCEDIP